MRQSLKNKIIIPVALALSILAITLTAFSSIKFSTFAHALFRDKMTTAANALQSYLDSTKHASKVATVAMSTNVDAIKAIKAHDKQKLAKVLVSALKVYDVDFYSVTDETGMVLLRTHDADERIFKQNKQNVLDALKGNVSTYYEEGDIAKVYVVTGSPVYDDNGKLIGTISAGIRLDTNEALDRLKSNSKADFTVFFGNTRIATTITTYSGERITGTQLDYEIAHAVLEEGKEFYGSANVLGDSYSTFYMPLLNAQNKPFAIIFTGYSDAHLISEEKAIIINGILIGSFGLVISVIALWLIIAKTIKPVNKLAHIVSEVSNGNVDVHVDKDLVTKDEVGMLLLDVYSLIDVIQSIVGDLSQLTHELNIHGDIHFQIDENKYSGSYRDIMVEAKTLANSVSMMKKTIAVVDYLETAVYVTDFNYKLLYVNRSMADTYGIDKKLGIGQTCYNAIRNLDKPCSFCQMQKLLPDKDTRPSADYEYTWDETTGTWIGGRSAIMRWVDGALAFLNSINNETVKMEQKEQLRKAAGVAEAASAAKSAFLANMSHELRTPLNVVVSLANLQLEKERLPPDISESLHKISNAGSTLLGLVNDILDVSKIESGNFVLTPVEYSVADLLNYAIMTVTSRINEKPIKFELDIDKNLPRKLYGDDLRVKQILANMLSNAVKYTDEGTIDLSVKCERDNSKNVWMDITVKDTGIGIQKENLKNIFSDYYQIDTDANRKDHGAGLGLAITKKLVDSMNGTISAESEYGKGCTFYIRIQQVVVDDTPISSDDIESLRNLRYCNINGSSTIKFSRSDLSHVKVLVVDDLPANLDVATGLLRKYNMQVDCVTSGREAISRIKGESPIYDAIFMDHMMPEMDGIETVTKIRALGTNYAKAIPIVALTANAIVGTEELFYAHGFQAYISKPIDVAQLDAVINRWIKSGAENNAGSNTPSIKDKTTSDDKDMEKKQILEIKIPGVDVRNGLANCDNDDEIYLSVLRSYVSGTSALLEKMHVVTTDTLPSYAISVHGIKGSSATIGAEDVREIAARLEAMAKSGDLSGVLATNSDFIQKTGGLVSTIHTWLEAYDNKVIKPILSAPDSALLADLRECCEHYDLRGAEAIMQKLDSATYEHNADLVAWIKEKMSSLELHEIAHRLAG